MNFWWFMIILFCSPFIFIIIFAVFGLVNEILKNLFDLIDNLFGGRGPR